MLRPSSQHCYALAAEAERMYLTIGGLYDHDAKKARVAAHELSDAEMSLQNAAAALIAAGNKLRQQEGC